MEGARGLAVILVFFVHYYWALRLYLPAESASLWLSKTFERIGHAGVDIFFVLSGYLIYSAVRSRNYETLRFLRRRAVRLYPTFLAMLGLYIALSWAVPGRSSKWPVAWVDKLAYLAQNLLLTPGILKIDPLLSVAWTLSYEVLFYLGMPLLMVGFRLGRRPQWIRLSVLALFGLSYGAASVLYSATAWPGPLLYPFNHIRMSMFLGGVFLYELKDAPWMERFFTSRHGAGMSFAVFLGGLALPLWITKPSYLSFLVVPAAWGEPVRTAGLLAGCPAFIACCLLANNFVARIMSADSIRWLGNMSYSYYLSHSLVVNGCGYGLHAIGIRQLPATAFWMLLPVTFAGTVLASALLFLVVEKPFSLAAKPRHRPAPDGNPLRLSEAPES
jgi:exopolysaccharide production protein ExoZ